MSVVVERLFRCNLLSCLHNWGETHCLGFQESRAVHCREEHLAKLCYIYSYLQLRREDEKETRCTFEVVIYMIQFLNKNLKI